MKKTFLLFGLAILLSMSAMSQIFTSGFESWTGNVPDNWVGVKTSLPADSLTQSATNPHGGSYAMNLKNSSTSSHKRVTTQTLTVTDGTSYTITYWVKGHGSIRCGLFDGRAADYGYATYTAYHDINSSTWAQFSDIVTAANDTTGAEFIFSIKSTFSDLNGLQVDDVSITQGAVSNNVTIYDIQYTTDASGDSPYINQVVTTAGIVTGKHKLGYFLQDGAGAWNGIYVYDDSASVSTINVGDSVEVSGTAVEYFTFTEISNVSSFSIKSSGNTLPTPLTVTSANFATEANEGVLVKIFNAECIETNSGFGMWTVSNNSGSDSTRIHNLIYAFTPTFGTSYDITGPTYFAYNEYRIEPRDASDVQVSTGINNYDQSALSIYPNPATSNVYINNISNIKTIKISNILGETIENINVTSNNTVVNVNAYSKGLYFISLLNNNGVVVTKKFVKQ